MERHALADRDEDRPFAGLEIEAFLQPAFVALFDAIGEISSFRANLAHVRVFGDGYERVCRDWLETMSGALDAAPEPMEREERRRTREGMRWWRITLVPFALSGGGGRSVLGLCADVTDAKTARLHLESAAFEDALTGLFNRRRFDRDLACAVKAARTGPRPFVLLLGDIDRFKPINDRHGHAAGDDILRRVAHCLREGVRREDRLYRIGGDEFSAILATGREATAAAVALRLRERVRGLALPDGSPLHISIGTAVWTPGSDEGDMVRRADAAMYEEKRSAAEGRQGPG